jgi:putative ABC transport system ATP-binding protein
MHTENEPAIVLETRHLGRNVGSTRLVEDVSLRVYAGEIVAVSGPSGSGKTTLLRLLNRLDEPTSGTVLLAGVDYRTLPPRAVRRRVGLVTQRPFLFPGTVADNIRFGPYQRGELLPDDHVTWLLEQVGLPDYARRDVGGLSGGEAQRVALLRVLVNEPQLLLLDEPTSALDTDSEQVVETLIRQHVAQQMACVLVSHRREQVARLAQRVLRLEAGRLLPDEQGVEVPLAP